MDKPKSREHYFRAAAANERGEINLLRMIESRIVEIVQIENEVKKKNPKLFSQRLPRYMRRRAGSHNPHRVPQWLKPLNSKLTAKDRSRLFKYRHKLRLSRHKRILKKHDRHKYKDPNKTILHKWFAKRFKLETIPESMKWVPLHNNTKNFRNLYRQTRYGCAYFSMGHFVAFQINSPYKTATLDKLNKLTTSISGFTFAARALENGRYEVVIYLYDKIMDPGATKARYEYICPAFVTNICKGTKFMLWVPRLNSDKVHTMLEATELPFVQIEPRDAMRLRFVGPEARQEALRIAADRKKHEEAIFDVDRRLTARRKFGISIGCYIEEKDACFTYYQTNPLSVDVVFRHRKEGRLLWHKLIRNKAHLVGGKRDIEELFKDKDCFRLHPDY